MHIKRCRVLACVVCTAPSFVRCSTHLTPTAMPIGFGCRMWELVPRQEVLEEDANSSAKTVGLAKVLGKRRPLSPFLTLAARALAFCIASITKGELPPTSTHTRVCPLSEWTVQVVSCYNDSGMQLCLHALRLSRCLQQLQAVASSSARVLQWCLSVTRVATLHQVKRRMMYSCQVIYRQTVKRNL